MRHFIRVFVFIMILFGSVGCSCKKTEKITLTDDQYTTPGEGKLLYMETFDFVQGKIDEKANLVFYMYGATCDGCKAFTPVIKKYAKEKGIIVYTVEINAVSRANEELQESMGYTPAVGIFKEGELYQNIHGLGANQGQYFKSTEGFASWFETYVELK